MTCSRFLFSTNGAIFKHPDRETVDLILKHASGPVELHFNYRKATTERFEKEVGSRHKAIYGDEGHIALDLAALP